MLIIPFLFFPLILKFYVICENHDVDIAKSPGFSSVWCYSLWNNNKRCSFSNLCYQHDAKFIFILTKSSILLGLDSKDDLKKIYATSVFGHSALPLKLSVIEYKHLQDVYWISNSAFLLHRFKPDNLMHVIHDDLLPLYTTYTDLCIGNVTYCKLKYHLFFSDDNISGPYLEWYDAFSRTTPVQLSQFNRSYTLCFSKLQVGLSPDSIFYQYGFLKPKGLNNFSPMTANLINQFRSYMLQYFQVPSTNISNHTQLVFISRRVNRKILNEKYVESAIQSSYRKEFNTSIKIFKTDFSIHPPKDILLAISQSQFILGMHGAGMFIALFLPPNSTVIELFPYGITEKNVSPLYVMSLIPGIQFKYFFWHNLNGFNSFLHPEYPSHFGGLSHLSELEQITLLNTSSNLLSYKCCSDALFLSRMYQDTLVDGSIFPLLKSVFKYDATNSDVYDIFYNLWFYPSFVQNISCFRKNGNLYLSWLPPINVLREAYPLYKVTIEGLSDHITLLTNHTKLEYTLSTNSSIQIWIMCLINATEGIDSFIVC